MPIGHNIQTGTASEMDKGTNNGNELKSVYTTGEVAKICSISQQTVIRCFDSGRLKGFRVPGSKFRRIPGEQLISFMKENQIPLDKIGQAKKRVLVIDDDEAIVELLVEILTSDGRFEVKSGSTGFDAGMLAREMLPDVILLDFKLPDINGTAVCKSIRANKHLAHAKIIMISGVTDPDEIHELRQAGANAYIKKPFDNDVVIARIAELIHI
jgi:two-component system, OmpR family, response regulator RpaA